MDSGPDSRRKVNDVGPMSFNISLEIIVASATGLNAGVEFRCVGASSAL